jgi:hypothetical protein
MEYLAQMSSTTSDHDCYPHFTCRFCGSTELHLSLSPRRAECLSGSCTTPLYTRDLRDVCHSATKPVPLCRTPCHSARLIRVDYRRRQRRLQQWQSGGDNFLDCPSEVISRVQVPVSAHTRTSASFILYSADKCTPVQCLQVYLCIHTFHGVQGTDNLVDSGCLVDNSDS